MLVPQSAGVLGPGTEGDTRDEEASIMTLHHAACTAAPLPRIKLPTCPLCGDMLLAPMLAEHVSAQHVRNHWVCESCGHSFRKSFRVEASVVEDVLAG
jgi:hypothetical protein